MAKTIRVPATTVELVQILGVILREYLRMELWNTECWTFEHVADWGESLTNPVPIDPVFATSLPLPEFEISVYLGSGRCKAFGYGSDPDNAKELQLRVRCEYSEWALTAMNSWDFQMWIRFPDGTIERHHYACHLGGGGGDDRDIFLVPANESRMPQDPPRRIAFWKQPAEAEQTA